MVTAAWQRVRRAASGFVLAALSACAGPGAWAEPSASPVFETEVRPLLQSHCGRCHGGKARKAELDLTTLAALRRGGESGPVVVPGKPDDSRLYQLVRDGKMPRDGKAKLTPADVALLRRWISGGARGRDVSAAGPALTQHDVYPILLRHCTVCHGRDRREAGLDLRRRNAMLRGGKSGPALVPGKPAGSLLLKKIRAGAMPPRERLVEVSVKPVEPAERDVLTRWIALGAPEVPDPPDVASVRRADRDFWAFRAPAPVTVPTVRHADRVRNPVDAFILQRLEQKGLSLAPEADRATLMRRAYFDLTGLPPEPAAVRAFLSDPAPDAYERMIDRLLASPRYGERWGRHWLDVAGYADSEGKREQDILRTSAWRYRDYVIRAFNADKPYARFLLEQIAGDELADYEHAAQITPELYDNLVATGFLRMAPDPTWANITNFVPDRLEVIADEIDVLGSAVLGLTMKCARCHSHKFDPIPQKDYYRLLAVFKGAYDENDWLRPGWLAPISNGRRADREMPYVTSAERREWQVRHGRWRREKGRKAPEPEQPTIRALWDRGEPSPTYVLRRGDPLQPGPPVQPGVPSVLAEANAPFAVRPPWPGAKKTGRRLAFARWLTRPDHPLTARVMVNRVWQHHFGTGIVRSLGNFGRAGTPPTHPELLDWLAREFVRKGWSVKALHRLLMTSAAYRQSSAVTADQLRLDPDNALYSRMPLRRLDAEELYDTLLLAAGRLDETRYGPPDAVDVRADGLATPQGTAGGWRRSVYVRQQRKGLPSLLETFDLPQMNPNCLERRNANVPTQALHLLNDASVEDLAARFARRVRHEVGPGAARQVEWVYLAALGRPPTDREKAVAVDGLARLTDRWARQLRRSPKPDPDGAAGRALATLCHAVVNSAAFLYVD
jgi:cytochrome c553